MLNIMRLPLTFYLILFFELQMPPFCSRWVTSLLIVVNKFDHGNIGSGLKVVFRTVQSSSISFIYYMLLCYHLPNLIPLFLYVCLQQLRQEEKIVQPVENVLIVVIQVPFRQKLLAFEKHWNAIDVEDIDAEFWSYRYWQKLSICYVHEEHENNYFHMQNKESNREQRVEGVRHRGK